MALIMTEFSAPSAGLRAIDDVLRQELAQGDAQIASIAPILRHLLANDEHSVFGDEVIARVRGMLADVARQLLDALAAARGDADDRDHPVTEIDALVIALSGIAGFLTHAHALALEWQLTERLQARLALDPVVSPLLQALIASNEPPTAAAAMALLAQQARFAQNQRRMQLPLSELPGDLFHGALITLQNHAHIDPAGAAPVDQAVAQIRKEFDEGRNRLGLISRLVAGMGGGASAALSIPHAGTAIFLSALAMASGQSWRVCCLARFKPRWATRFWQAAQVASTLRGGSS